MLMLIKSRVAMTLREMSLSGQKLPPKDLPLSDYNKLQLSWREIEIQSIYILTVTFILTSLAQLGIFGREGSKPVILDYIERERERNEK